MDVDITADATQETKQVVPEPIAPALPIDIEFENAWETTSDWNDDDQEAVKEEIALCFPARNNDKPA